MKKSPFGAQKDTYFMGLALKEAQKSFKMEEVPVGAVVVDFQGNVIAQAHNQVEAQHTQRAHAESLAIEKAGKKNQDWRLEGCWLYVTLEPCAMCMALIRLSRLSGVVFGAPSPLFGFRVDKQDTIRVYKKDVPELVEGILADEASTLLKKFFNQQRIKKGESCESRSRKSSKGS